MVLFVPHRPGSGAPGGAELPLLCLPDPQGQNLTADRGRWKSPHISPLFQLHKPENSLRFSTHGTLLLQSHIRPVWELLIEQQMKPWHQPWFSSGVGCTEVSAITIRGFDVSPLSLVPAQPLHVSLVERAWEKGGEAGVRAVIWSQRIQQGILTDFRLSCSWSWLSVSSCELSPSQRRTTKALSRAAKCKEIMQPESLPIISLHQQPRLLLFRQLSLLCFAFLASWNWSTQICKLKPSRIYCC